MKKDKLAIFDIDGTIFRKNLHFELITELVYSGVFKKTSREEIQSLYGKWVNQKHTYEEHRDRMVDLYRKNIVGCKKVQIKKAAQKVVSLNAQRVYIFTKELIKKLRKEGYCLVVISGSPIEIVKEYAENLNFDKFFGSIYELDEKGFYTGEELFVPVDDKGRIVKKLVQEEGFSFGNSYGVGDTQSDAKFLELVENPIAFNPNKNLKAIAEKKGWKIVAERKDVIYKIN